METDNDSVVDSRAADVGGALVTVTFFSFAPLPFFFPRQSLTCSPGWPGTQYVKQAGLGLRDLPISVSCAMIKGVTYHDWLINFFINTMPLRQWLSVMSTSYFF